MSHLDELNQSVVQEPIRTVMEAVQEDNFELVKLMIDEGVDVDLRDDEGWQAIHYAAWCSEPMRYLKFFLSVS